MNEYTKCTGPFIYKAKQKPLVSEFAMIYDCFTECILYTYMPKILPEFNQHLVIYSISKSQNKDFYFPLFTFH